MNVTIHDMTKSKIKGGVAYEANWLNCPGHTVISLSSDREVIYV